MDNFSMGITAGEGKVHMELAPTGAVISYSPEAARTLAKNIIAYSLLADGAVNAAHNSDAIKITVEYHRRFDI